jgi:hypothetical protein
MMDLHCHMQQNPNDFCIIFTNDCDPFSKKDSRIVPVLETIGPDLRTEIRPFW